MKIHACIKGLEKKFIFNSPELVEEISSSCPVIRELFYEKTYPLSLKEKGKKGPRKYRIRFDKENRIRLQLLGRQIDRYIVDGNNGQNYDDPLKYDFIRSFRDLARLSMMKEKDIHVVCSD